MGTVKQAIITSRALRFVLLIGIMSFFADFTYEGSRSIIGPYLALLGASAIAVATITGSVRTGRLQRYYLSGSITRTRSR